MPPRSSRSATAANGTRSQPARTGTVSLARALSKLGLCSRSQAAQAVRDGRVRVNGKRITDGSVRVNPDTSDIRLDGAPATPPVKTYLMLNKPRGLVTTRHDPAGRATVYDCLTDPSLPFLGPVGRLDQASEGLLLFSNDTQWANAITAPTSHVTKTYHVQIDRVPGEDLLAQLRTGVAADSGDALRVLHVDVLRTGTRNGWLQIELDEGRNRHIRRMLDAVGVTVLRLVRVAIGPLALGTLAKGASRMLTPSEVAALSVPRRRATPAPARRARVAD